MKNQCTHIWRPSTVDRDGRPVFRKGPVSWNPTVHATCTRCNVRTWLTKAQWDALTPMEQSND